MKMKVALTGGDGLIGSKIVEILSKNFEVFPISHQQMDITDRENVFNVIKNLDFDVFIHIAAYTDVDKAEIEKEKALKVNVEGTRNVFDAFNNYKSNSKFIYISTDFVFDGRKENTPFFEDSKPNPIQHYGLTKYLGEEIVKGKGIIVRISYPYRTKFDKKMDFVRKIKRLLEEKREIFLITDSLIVPTFIDDIANALSIMLKNLENLENKVFHIVGSQALSPYECGKIIANAFNLDDSLIKEITYEEYFKNKAKRPQFSDIRTKNNNFYRMNKFEDIIFKFKDEFK